MVENRKWKWGSRGGMCRRVSHTRNQRPERLSHRQLADMHGRQYEVTVKVKQKTVNIAVSGANGNRNDGKQHKQDRMKKRSERRKHCALAVVRRSRKICSAADPFPGAQDGQNLISWRWSLPLPTNPVWWGAMDAISSYRGNRPTNTNTPTYTPINKQTHRQDRLQYTTPLSLARSVIKRRGNGKKVTNSCACQRNVLCVVRISLAGTTEKTRSPRAVSSAYSAGDIIETRDRTESLCDLYSDSIMSHRFASTR